MQETEETKERIIHPAAMMLPAMTEQELDALTLDIQLHGQREPVEIFEDQILDGRHRVAACFRLGIEPQYHEVGDIGDPLLYVVSKNLHRRQLSTSQRAMIASRLKDKLVEAHKNSNLKNDGPTNSTELAAKMLGVSVGLISAADYVRRHDVPELVAQVMSGQMSVSGAADLLKTPSPPKGQQSTVSEPDSKPDSKPVNKPVPAKPQQTASKSTLLPLKKHASSPATRAKHLYRAYEGSVSKAQELFLERLLEKPCWRQRIVEALEKYEVGAECGAS